MMKAGLILALVLFAAVAMAQPDELPQEAGSQHGGPPHGAALQKAFEACKASAHDLCGPPPAADNAPEIAIATGSESGSGEGMPPPPPFELAMCLFSHIDEVDAECKAALATIPKPPQAVITAFEACHDSIPEECAPNGDAPADASQTGESRHGGPRGPRGPRGMLGCLKQHVDSLEGACKAAVEALPERPQGGHHGPRSGPRGGRGGHGRPHGGSRGSHGQQGPPQHGDEDNSALRGHGGDSESDWSRQAGGNPHPRHGGRHRVWKLIAAGGAGVVAIAVIVLVVRRVRRKRRTTTIANGIVIRKDGFQSVATNPASAEVVKGSEVALV